MWKKTRRGERWHRRREGGRAGIRSTCRRLQLPAVQEEDVRQRVRRLQRPTTLLHAPLPRLFQVSSSPAETVDGERRVQLLVMRRARGRAASNKARAGIPSVRSTQASAKIAVLRRGLVQAAQLQHQRPGAAASASRSRISP